jgi:ribokinase
MTSSFNGRRDGRPNRVAVLGSLNMDLVVRVDRLPVAGETVMGQHFLTASGGKGANQAVAAAKLGAKVTMLGCVGLDDHGRRLLQSARGAGVNVRRIRRLTTPTGVALIVVERRGQNIIAVASGANGCVTPEFVSDDADLIARSDLLVAQLETPLEAISTAASIARSAGVPFLLNAAPARSDLGGLLSRVTILVVNETELSVVSGVPDVEGREGEVASRLLSRGPEVVVVTLGARGSLLVDKDGVRSVSSYPVDAVDATAAGDAFVGALAARFRGMDSLDEATRYASAAGAVACTRPGAQPSLPVLAEVEQLLSR